MGNAPVLERWHELKPLFEQALDLEPVSRASFLETLALRRPELHQDLQRLLSRHATGEGLGGAAAQRAAELLDITEARDPPLAADVARQNVAHGVEAGRVVGPFRLLRLVGSGGMGAVYEAERVSGGFRQRVAIKLIAGLHPGLAERFAQERQILADLNHPNIPPLLDGGETADGLPWLATEFIEGSSLTEYAEHHELDCGGRVGLLLKVAEALAYAHRRGVIHRDIKPANILVTDEATVKLLDFGIARLVDDSGGALTRQVLGPMTPEFAAPEQFRGEPAGVATDIYQFGVLAFRLLSGGYPYAARPTDPLAFARAVCEQPPLRLPAPDAGGATLRPDTRRQWQLLRALVERCLQKRPEQRWADMRSLIDALEDARDSSALPARQLPRNLRNSMPAPRRLLAALALALLLSAAIWSVGLLPPAVDPWAESPALHGMGLSSVHLHAARDDTDAALRRALRAEAEGDLDRALAVLESVHAVDPKTPVPAMLLAYWSSVRAGQAEVDHWQEQARTRLEGIDDRYLHLLQRFIEAEVGDDSEGSLRYAAALLDAQPQAWFLRLARAHLLNGRGLRAAALRELQQIDVSTLDHRKLAEAVADRASLGDLAGAGAMAAAVASSASAPEYAMLKARLAYSAGSLMQARQYFADAVASAQEVAHLAIEARALLYLGVVEGSMGQYAQALEALHLAQQRLSARGQFNFAVDAALAQAQIVALQGRRDLARLYLQQARDLRMSQYGHGNDPMIDLFAARLEGAQVGPDARYPPPANALLRARQALASGNAGAAREALEEARREGAPTGVWFDEYVLLCRELDLAEPALPPIDPPFQPYARFATRWALDAGASVVPPPQ